jgi:5-methylcytosine-specific restriction endonuclease McrA
MTTPNYPALVLNADFTPVSVHPLSTWGFERTIRNFLKDRITPVSFYETTLRSVNMVYRIPSVIALKDYVKIPQRVPFTRMNIFLRDDFTCQYCNVEFSPKDLTFDHVIPRSVGGPTSFENIVACCVPCNTRKADRRNMKPLRIPRVPKARDLARATPPRETLHKTWIDHCYWLDHLER